MLRSRSLTQKYIRRWCMSVFKVQKYSYRWTQDNSIWQTKASCCVQIMFAAIITCQSADVYGGVCWMMLYMPHSLPNLAQKRIWAVHTFGWEARFSRICRRLARWNKPIRLAWLGLGRWGWLSDEQSKLNLDMETEQPPPICPLYLYRQNYSHIVPPIVPYICCSNSYLNIVPKLRIFFWNANILHELYRDFTRII